MKVTDVLLLATLTVLVLVATHTNGAPTSQRHLRSNQPGSETVARWVLSQLADNRRERRTQLDAGFLSRHSALQTYLNSYDAASQAGDPNGPGRRK